jgi:CHAT domain-containing protein
MHFQAGPSRMAGPHGLKEGLPAQSARMLTTELFRQEAANPTLARAGALRPSMLALMQESRPGFSYAHPIFWAPYSIVGDGG